MSDETNATPTLNGAPVTPEQLQEEKEKLPGNEKIIEKSPNEFRRLQRFQE